MSANLTILDLVFFFFFLLLLLLLLLLLFCLLVAGSTTSGDAMIQYNICSTTQQGITTPTPLQHAASGQQSSKTDQL
jgi:hypothetical protein